jgi:imidazolonepropionase-like amidohydrolase
VAATSGPARSFKIADRGRIEAGKRADLILVRGNPLTDIDATRDIVRVFKNGFDVARSVPAAPK